MKHLNRNELTNKLNRIWYIVDTEDENKKRCVARRDVLPLVTSAIKANPAISDEELWDTICDNSLECELEGLHYGATIEEAYTEAQDRSLKVGELLANVLVNSDNSGLKPTHFEDFCNKLCVALNIEDTGCVISINPEYWAVAYDDGLSPLEAVKQYQ